jgi:hypothetical protein
MDVRSKIRGVIGPAFQLGLRGPNLINSPGIVEVRDASGASLAIARGAYPIGDDDLATKYYVDTHGGGGGATTLTKTPFAFNSSSPLVVRAAPAGSVVTRVVVSVLTTFDDVQASITFGTVAVPDLLLKATDTSLQVAAQYEVPDLVPILASGNLLLTVHPLSSTQGSGLLICELLT